MGPIQHEVAVGKQPAFQIVDQITGCIEHPAALVTHHVDVVVLDRSIRRRAMPEVGMPNEPDRLEELESPVHRGEVDLRHRFADLLRGGVAQLAHRAQHQVALRRHAQAPGVQLCGQVGLRRNRRVGVVLVASHHFHRRYRGAVTASAVKLLAVLGSGLVDPGAAVLRADDAGAVRGDGCFEGCRIQTDAAGHSVVDKLDAHLARMARSAAGLGITFDEPAWRELIALVCTHWSTPGEAALKLVLTRGVADRPTGFVTVSTLSPDIPRLRRDGLNVITLSRGTTSDAFVDAPWLLGGIKTLSYAVNMAAMREAERQGADDVILVSADGQVLEAPTSSVLWSIGRDLYTIPTGANGILGGTTQHLLFDNAERAGWTVRIENATVDRLHEAEVVWLTSSVRGPIDIVKLDGKPRTRFPDIDAEIRRLSGF